MTAYHHPYPQYTGHELARRPSQPITLHGHIGHDPHAHGYFDRDPLYTQSTGRSDARHDPTAYRNYTLPTPIHDQEPDNSQGRRRVTLACARCRKRKIKCSGDPSNGMGCQACRSSGADVTHCTFDRIGTTHKYCVDSNSANSPTTPTGSYGATGYAGLPVDGSSRSLSYSQLDAYGFEMQNPPEAQFSDDRIWATHRPSQNGYANMTPVTSYDTSYHTPMPRIITNSETLAPLSMTTLQSGLSIAVDRRLPAPNLIGTPMSAELASPTASVSGRFASMSLGGPQSRNSIENSSNLPPTGRQKSIQELANASVMLPPVPRDYKTIAPAPLDQAYLFSNVSAEDLYATCTAAAVSSSYTTSLPPMPPMLPSSSLGGPRYTSIPTSAPTISTIVASDRPVSRYDQASRLPEYGWPIVNGLPQRRTSAANTSDDGDNSQPQRYQPIAVAPIISSSSCSQPQLVRTNSSHSSRREKGKSRVGSTQYGPSGKL